MYDSPSDLVKYHLKCLLLTAPGEKISDPSYGVGLRRYLFEMNNGTLTSNLTGIVASQVSRYIPSVRLERIIIPEDFDMMDMNALSIKIIYSIPGFVTNEIFEMNIKNEETIGFY